MTERRIDELGRVIIPGDMREKLGIDYGSKVILEVRNSEIVIKPAKTRCRLCGANENINKDLCICEECISKIKAQ